MNKTLKHTLLLSIFVFAFILSPLAVIKLSVLKMLLSKVEWLIPLAVISIVFSFTLLKHRIAGITAILSTAFLIALITYVIKQLDDEYEEEIHWNDAQDEFTCKFIVGPQGRFYLKGAINNAPGLFLFDTGCSITSFNEKYISKTRLRFGKQTNVDANGIRQSKHINSVKHFELEKIEFNNLKVYPLDSLTWTSPKGIFHKQDSILGIIGNNIISKFIWDFDLTNQQVTISNNLNYCKNLPDSLSINLVPQNNCKAIPLALNQTNKMLLLDFGCSSPIILADSIPKDKGAQKNSTKISRHNGPGAFSHLDTTNTKQTNHGAFVNVQFGPHRFNEIECIQNNHSNLLGMPFIWAFKRVVLDFEKNKAYFISRYKSNKYNLHNHNFQSTVNRGKVINFYPGEKGTVITINKDSLKLKYLAFGYSQLIKINNNADSLFCTDSVRLPNGTSLAGPIMIKLGEQVE